LQSHSYPEEALAIINKSVYLLTVLFVFLSSAAYPYGAETFDVAGNYVWNVPPDVTRIYVTAAGAGGGGGGGGLNYDIPEQRDAGVMRTGGGGGGGACFVKKIFEVNPGDTLSISCGTGGVGGKSGAKLRIAEEGKDGGLTYIEGLFSLPGGGGAKIPLNYPNPHAPALGGLPGGKGGQRGGFGSCAQGVPDENSGAGGNTLIGFGGQSGNLYSPAGDGGCYGGGGGGGGARTDTNTYGKGGNGGDGVVIIEYDTQNSTGEGGVRLHQTRAGFANTP
jgi:hypothetical protein